MRTIEIAIAENACLLREGLAATVSLLQYHVTLKVLTIRELLEQLQTADVCVDVCIANVSCPDFIKCIGLLKKYYPQLALIGYTPDDRNSNTNNIHPLVDYYLSAPDTVVTLNRAIIKSYLRYH